MSRIKGVAVTLVIKVETGKDPLGAPIYTDAEIEVENVLVSPTKSEDIVNQLALTGKRAVYTLAIPKGDANIWENQEVRFFGKRWRVFGAELEGIEDMIPLDWNKKIMVESYEGGASINDSGEVFLTAGRGTGSSGQILIVEEDADHE